ncbi:alpha/beta fold hydrolase [Amphibacillus cookii]|uniref:alpha/beta fold hydrolase n=1 Tax=Amphibacillus cookii TaxID=767787 RepID=UPI00195D7643|nr:alpha/beta hydrolase [Amphibacillus cookii]MBM7542576.1 pimeloyl-ACP methyl ester carboxylesterase [Amphibacillus cookii]
MKTVKFEQNEIFYEVMGEGLPILFIHPPGLGRTVFQSQLSLAKYYQLILPDFSGHGQSTAQYRLHIIDQYCKEIEAILDQEDISKVIICAYSAGGVVGQIFACHYPDRVEALIIAGGYPNVKTSALHLIYLAGMFTLRISRNFLSNRLAASNTTNDDDRKKLLKHIHQSNPNKWYQYYLSTHQVDIRHYINKINCKSLIIYGNLTDFTHYYQRYYQDNKFIQLAYVELGTHQIPPKKAEAFNHLIREFIDHHI